MSFKQLLTVFVRPVMSVINSRTAVCANI